MKEKTTKAEKQLLFVAMFFLLFQITKHFSIKGLEMLNIYLMSVSGIFAIIKIIRFYTQANKIIKIIWLTSMALIIIGLTLAITDHQIGKGISAFGSVGFLLTWHSSFLVNRSDTT